MSEHSIVDFFSLYDRVNEFLASEQRKYAKNLIRTKHELGLNQKQMAILSGKPYEDYLELEFSPLGLGIGGYELAFARLSKVTDADIQQAIALIKDYPDL